MSTPAAPDAFDASFHLLGPVTVTVADQPVRLGGPRQVAVLARLALSPGQVVGMDQLADSVWDDEAPAHPDVTIRSYVSHLRRSIEPGRRAGDRNSVIERVAHGYRLVVDPDRIDAVRFENLVKGGRQQLAANDPAQALRQLDQARSLWRGEPCEGLIESDAIMAFRSRLSELALVAAELSFEARLALGEHETVLPDLEVALGEHPLRERLTELAMLALYRAGRQSDALAVCQRLRRRLLDGLGVDPGPSVRQLEHRILTHDESLAPMPVSAPVPAAHPAPPAGDRERRVNASGTTVRLAGRARELTRLAAVANALEQGRGTALLVTGEAGAGKTALASLLGEQLAGTGVEVRWGRCLALAQGQVLWPWRQVLAGPGDPDSFSDAASATAAFPALAERLAHQSRQRPLLIVLEDLHWADEASIELLAFLGAALADAPVAFVATWRPGDITTGPRRAALRDLSRLPTATRINLAGLKPDDVADLLEPGAPFGPALAEALCLVSGGNPFLIRELLATLHDHGPGTDGDDAQEHGPFQGDATTIAGLLLDLPPSASMIDMVLSRVERLDGPGHDLLTVAAVMPGSFHAELLAEVVGLTVPQAEQALDTATEAGLLHEGAEPGTYRFAQPVAARAIEASLPGPRLARLHAAAGHACWRRGADPAVIAHHFARARSTGTSLLAARFALESVQRHGTPARLTQAATLGSEALDAVEHLDGAEALAVDLALVAAQAARLRGDGAGQQALGDRALAAARQAGNVEIEAVAALGATGPQPAGPPAATLSWVGSAADATWAGQVLTDALQRIGPEQGWRPVLEARRARLAALEPSRRQDVPLPPPPSAAETGAALTAPLAAQWREWLLASAAFRPGVRWAEAATLVDPTTRADNQPGSALTGHDRLLAFRLALADLEHWPAGAQPVEVLTGLAGPGSPEPGSFLDTDLAATQVVVATISGRVDEAAEVVEARRAHCHRAGITTTTSFDRQLVALRWEQGRFADMAALTRTHPTPSPHPPPGEAPRRHPTREAPPPPAPTWEARPGPDRPWGALALAELGLPDAARAALDDLVAGDGAPWLWCLVAAAAHRCGHRPAAERAAAELAPWHGLVAMADHGLVVLGPVSYFAALTAATRQAGTAALALLAQAEATARRAGAPGWLVRVLAARAEIAAADHDWGRAEQLLGDAKDLAAAAGLGWLDGWLSSTGGIQPSFNRFSTG